MEEEEEEEGLNWSVVAAAAAILVRSRSSSGNGFFPFASSIFLLMIPTFGFGSLKEHQLPSWQLTYAMLQKEKEEATYVRFWFMHSFQFRKPENCSTKNHLFFKIIFKKMG